MRRINSTVVGAGKLMGLVRTRDSSRAVYQAWTLAKGAKTVQPSMTFIPDVRTALVAVSVEPTGGSERPTTKPIAAVPLGG